MTTGAAPLFLLLTIAAAVGRPLFGATISLAYGLGRGAPFLLLGFFAEAASRWLARAERGRRIAEVASVVALILIAVYFARLAFVLA